MTPPRQQAHFPSGRLPPCSAALILLRPHVWPSPSLVARGKYHQHFGQVPLRDRLELNKFQQIQADSREEADFL